MDIDVALPVRFDALSTWPHRTSLTAQATPQGWTFTLSLTNRATVPLAQGYSACEPITIERIPDGVRVWQTGNLPCIAILLGLELKPNETHTQTARWDGKDSTGRRVAAGQYRVKMALNGFIGETLIVVK
ncbi:hypothetical protein [Deinococcus sp. QL22]|uniref:hypothetical protein n=1 Tax=Deinococcus sp. QL22 TaxID=2939437 RepID=UPI002016E471|nr:hypothetical protein [Deinococcus sp. QL22]UQN06572.1 hypothetical protein M1R55_01230 [Deinococcus sp. QL22]